MVDDREYLRNSFEAFLVEHGELVDKKHLHCNEFSYFRARQLREIQLGLVLPIKLLLEECIKQHQQNEVRT